MSIPKDMEVIYRLASRQAELEPKIEKFFEFYNFYGTRKIRVEPHIAKSYGGAEICPAEKNSCLEVVCVESMPAEGKLIRAGKEYLTFNIHDQTYVVHPEHKKSVFRR